MMYNKPDKENSARAMRFLLMRLGPSATSILGTREDLKFTQSSRRRGIKEGEVTSLVAEDMMLMTR